MLVPGLTGRELPRDLDDVDTVSMCTLPTRQVRIAARGLTDGGVAG